PTSIAPSALSLLPDEQSIAPRTGIYALGNPYPTQQNLRWGEAEAFTLAELGQRLARSAGVRVQWQATRKRLIEALHTGLVVNAASPGGCCCGPVGVCRRSTGLAAGGVLRFGVLCPDAQCAPGHSTDVCPTVVTNSQKPRIPSPAAESIAPGRINE